jgi:hypothetical protein
VFAACAALVLTGSAARAEVFRYKYRPGQVIQSRASLAGASMMGQNGTPTMLKSQFRMVMRQTQRVRSVSGGVVTLDITDTPLSGSSTTGGRTEGIGKTPTRSLVRLTERGKFLSRKALSKGEDDSPSPLDGTDVLYGLNFPARDLKPGDSWSETLNVGTAGSTQKVNVTWKYLGKETFRGRTCARISTVFSMPMARPAGMEEMPAGFTPPSGKLSGSTVTYFDPRAGVEVYSSGSVLVTARADLSQLSAEAGEFVTVMKINVVQSLLSRPR